MKFKIFIIVILSSFLIGVALFLILESRDRMGDKVSGYQNPLSSSLDQNSSTPIPTPTLLPLNKDSNLVREINSLTPKDYSEDFKKLKDELTQ